MAGTEDLALHGPDERPALQAGQPRVWHCQAASGHPRDTARHLLQRILGDYLGTPPRIGFEAGAPPRTDAAWQGLELSLSLSYAGSRALIGICAGARVGVDITPVQPLPEMASLARLFLGPAGATALAVAPAHCRVPLFACLWAELEARGKCLGQGLEEWSPLLAHRLDHPAILLHSVEWRGHAVAVASLALSAGPGLRSSRAG